MSNKDWKKNKSKFVNEVGHWSNSSTGAFVEVLEIDGAYFVSSNVNQEYYGGKKCDSKTDAIRKARKLMGK